MTATGVDSLTEHPCFKVTLVFNEAILLRVLFSNLVRILVEGVAVRRELHVDKVYVLWVKITNPIAHINDLFQDVLALVHDSSLRFVLIIQLLFDDLHDQNASVVHLSVHNVDRLHLLLAIVLVRFVLCKLREL